METKKHRKLTRRIIDIVNYLIDNPPAWMPDISEQLGIVPGLSYKGHRRKGHDIVTAALNGIITGAIEGFTASGAHLSLDAFRDELRRRLGPAAADVAEDLIMLAYEVYLNYTGQKRVTRKRKSARTRS